MTDAYICDAIRTPIGRFTGGLATVRPDDLAAIPIAALLARNPNIDPAVIDDVFFGCANQAGEDNRNVARMASLLAGLPISVPGTTINRLCASGADAVGTAARAIIAGQIDLAIAGGVESMTRAPYVMAKGDKPFSRSMQIEDTVVGWRLANPKMKALYNTASMPETGENVAQQYKVSREAQDAYALQSQMRAAQAQAAGYFAEEIVPVTIPSKKGDNVVSVDEHPRPETTLEMLAKLKPVVRADGTVTAGNASGINDGAAAMFIASEAAVKRHGLTPHARVLGMATAGVAPDVMGIGPVPACRKLMERLGLTIKDFDLIELNEAFASQVIASMRELGVDPASTQLNPHGGAIALGHPLGMSGARLAMTAAHGLRKTGGKRALVTMCIGVGQGLALAIERV
jgi:3-oxoadipyl-CoA thiolase